MTRSLQRISRELAASAPPAAGTDWASLIDTLARLMQNRLTRLRRIHELRRDAISSFWQMNDKYPQSGQGVMDMFGGEAMAHEKREEFQVSCAIARQLP